MKNIHKIMGLSLLCVSDVFAANCPVLTPKDVSEVVKPLGLKNDEVPDPYMYQDNSGKQWNLKGLSDLVATYRHESFGIEKVTSVSEEVVPHRRLEGVRTIKCAYKLQLTSTVPGSIRVDRIDLVRIDTSGN